MSVATSKRLGDIRPGRRVSRDRPGLVRFGFLAPFYVPFALFFIVPILYAIYQSTLTIHRTGGVFGPTTEQFAGFGQYAAVFTDPAFTGGLLRVLLFALIQVPLMTFIAVSLALLLGATRPRLAKVFRSIFFIPYAVPSVIAAIMWAYLYQPATSPLNDVGINLPLLGTTLILPSIANIGIWGWAGFNMILMVSALTSIPDELLEAAKIDGASELRIALSIKLPLIRPTIIMSAIFSIIGTLQLFTEPTVLRSISSAISSSFTPNMLAYNHAVGDEYSYAAAVSVSLAVITFIFSFGFLRIVRRTGRP